MFPITEIHCEVQIHTKFALDDENLSPTAKAVWLLIVSNDDSYGMYKYFSEIDETSPFYEAMKELIEKEYFYME